jgi:hypothetical protein
MESAHQNEIDALNLKIIELKGIIEDLRATLKREVGDKDALIKQLQMETRDYR